MIKFFIYTFMENDKSKLKDELIYDLIFSEKTHYEIQISRYIDNIYKYDRFISEIKKTLKKSKVIIVMEKVNLDIDGVNWEIKVKK